MQIGIPKERKDQEYRVGATPAMVRALSDRGHEVFVERGAGNGVGFFDDLYEKSGAKLVSNAEDVWNCDLVVKVKEPLPSEYPYLKKGLILFCYLHLAPEPVLTEALIKSGVTAIAYETVTDGAGNLPLLIPMSEMAGRIAVQVGAVSLQKNFGGKGVLLGGVPGVPPAHVVVIGGGIVGTESARMAMGLGAQVTIIDKNLDRLRELDRQFGPRLTTLFSSSTAIDEALRTADLVIGAVLVPGKLAPKLVTEEHIKALEVGSVVVDVAIDQGGCFSTSRPTTHSDPTYLVDGIVHYCVTNMPGACAVTATRALTNATTDYVQAIADHGLKALLLTSGLIDGVNVMKNHVTNTGVAHDQNRPFTDASTLL